MSPLDAIASGSTPSRAARLRSTFAVFAVNAVPLVGVRWFGWSAANVLVLYWIENLLIAIGTCVRIVVHRRLTRKDGHWRSDVLGGVTCNGAPVKTMTLLQHYAMVAFVFTAAHGVFVALIVAGLQQEHPGDPAWRFSAGEVAQGAAAVALMLATELFSDLRGIERRRFAWIRDYAERRIGRVIALHLAIIAGMFAMAWTGAPISVLYALIGLKLATELGAPWAAGERPPDALPEAPPRWVLATLGRLARGGPEALAEAWRGERERQRRLLIEDEETRP